MQPKARKRVTVCEVRPEELQSKAGIFLVQTVHALEVTEKKQMYRGELIGLEEKVKEIAEQIEELLKSMRELGV